MVGEVMLGLVMVKRGRGIKRQREKKIPFLILSSFIATCNVRWSFIFLINIIRAHLVAQPLSLSLWDTVTELRLSDALVCLSSFYAHALEDLQKNVKIVI